MSDVPSSLATAIEFHQKGDLEAAIGLYQDFIDSDPVPWENRFGCYFTTRRIGAG